MTHHRAQARAAALTLAALLAACAHPPGEPALEFAQPTPVRGTPSPAPPTPPPRVGLHSTIIGGRAVAAAPAPTHVKVVPKSGDVTIDFAATDVREVAKAVLGGILGLQYSVAGDVGTPVTLVTTRPVARSEVLRLFEDALKNANLALVPQNGVFAIQPIEAARASAPNVVPEGNVPGFARETLTLQFVSADELKKLLDPILPGVVISADNGRNVLVVAGSTGQRTAVRELVQQFDVNWLRGVSFALFVPQRTDARLIAPELEKLLNAPGAPTNGLVRLISMERLNGILAISGQRQYLEDTRRFVELLDREGESSQPRMFLYRVQNGRAADLAKVILTALGGGGTVASGQPGSVDAIGSGRQIGGESGGGFGGNGGFGGGGFGGGGNVSGYGNANGGNSGGFGANGGVTGGQGAPGFGGGSQGGRGGLGGAGGFGGAGGGTGTALNNVPASARLANPAAGQSGAVGGTQGGSALNATITADESTNSILVYGNTRDYAIIEDALRQLDTPPAQVLIEAAISEVTLTKALRYGIQTIFQSGRTSGVLSQSNSSSTTLTPLPGNAYTSLASQVVQQFPGFSFLYANKDISEILNAIEGVTKVNVLSAPKLLVLNNETASLQVGNQVPVTTGSITSSIAGANTANSIDYRDTGVILKVTPRVNASGLVLLDVAQEVSDVVASTNGGSAGAQSPTFSTRRIADSIAIQDGETIALGGLIRDSQSRSRSGIPLLSRIPIIGPFLFGNTDNSGARTELLILLRPRVIRTVDDGRAITEELKRKIQLVRPFKPGQTLP